MHQETLGLVPVKGTRDQVEIISPDQVRRRVKMKAGQALSCLVVRIPQCVQIVRRQTLLYGDEIQMGSRCAMRVDFST